MIFGVVGLICMIYVFYISVYAWMFDETNHGFHDPDLHGGTHTG